MSWHNRDCSIPDLNWRDGYPTCIRCNSSASSIANGAAETPPPPAPPPGLKRSQLRCSWPKCVEYSERFIDQDGNDLTKFIIENIDAWNIDANDPPDDQASLEEVIDASLRTDKNSEAPELSTACVKTTNTDTSDGFPETTDGKIHAVSLGSKLPHRSDRIHQNISGHDDFRLLRLNGSVSFDDPIQCSLEVAQLNNPDVPLYEALSYTWADLDGDKRNCVPIYIGTHFDVLLVTKNCHSALRRLRKRSDRLLWIDAICINQNDAIERSAQVNQMAKIYSMASRVLIYLGEESNESIEALPMINNCALTSTTRKEFLVELAKRPYFKRLWVIQEVGLASRASVICGGLIMHWTDLCSMFQSCGAAPEWIKHFSAPVHRRREAPSVFDLLRDTRDALCIDPRDRLFGIIGLAKSTEKDLLPTDYSLSAQQLYTGLAAYLIQKADNHEFLKLACNQRKIIPGLPSWVPDWTSMRTEESGAMMPELLVDSPYEAFPRLFWSHDTGKETVFLGGSISASLVGENGSLRSMNLSRQMDLSRQTNLPSQMDLLMSPPLVQPSFGALIPYAIPLFRVSRAELKTHEVAGGTKVTNWRMHRVSELFNHADELEVFVIPSFNGTVILRKLSSGIFSLKGFISILLNRLNSTAAYFAISRHIASNISLIEFRDLVKWLCVVLGLHISSNIASQDSARKDSAGKDSTHKASLFPDLSEFRDVEYSLRGSYQKPDQIGFNSDQFEVMDLMHTTMVNAIDPEDLAWRSRIPSGLRNWGGWDSIMILGKVQMFAEELPVREESVEEQINTWSSSVAQLKSQLQEQGSFSDAFQDLQADCSFNPVMTSHPADSDQDWDFLMECLGLRDGFKEVVPKHVHLSLFLQKAYSVISCATLDKNLPWDYNRDRFWMCMVSFDLIVRLRLLLADRQLYAQMERSIRSSTANPKRIVVI